MSSKEFDFKLKLWDSSVAIRSYNVLIKNKLPSEFKWSAQCSKKTYLSSVLSKRYLEMFLKNEEKKTICFAIDTHWRTNSQNDEDKTPILSTKMCSNATILLMLSIAMPIEQTLLYDVDFVISFLCLFCFVLGLLSIPAPLSLSLYVLSRLAFVRSSHVFIFSWNV